MEIISLWPGTAPGEKGDIGEELDTTAGKDDIIRTGNVTHPTITVFRPTKDKANGAAVMVCPGGGYNILALNLEGTEVCEWFNSIGVTAFLLKYRVPARIGLARFTAPLQDAQRALGILRARAAEWAIDPTRIGILGFSAGGHLSATASTHYDARTYPVIDSSDSVSCKPDFTVLIYPAYITKESDLSQIADEIKVTAKTPSTFIAMTQDDPVHVENAFVYASALNRVKVPVELHIYPKGGHGYGLRHSENPVCHWPDRVADWLKAGGWLKKRG